MARRRRRDDTAVSLFPFLSVLACVIGTLSLLLSALAVGAMGKGSVEQMWLAERLHAAEIFLAGGRAMLEELEAQLKLEEEREERDEELGRRLAGLGLEQDISLEELTEWANLQAETFALAERAGSLDQKVRELNEDLRRKESDLENRRARRATAPIIIDPTGVGRDQAPYLVVCTADYIELFHRYGEAHSRFPSDQLESERDFKRYLRQVKNISNALVIFMIRPDGLATYDLASTIANRIGVRNAKLPLPGTGELDFSLLRESRQ